MCPGGCGIIAGIADSLGYGDQSPQTGDEIILETFAVRPELLAEMKTDHGGASLNQPEQKHKEYELSLVRRDDSAGFNTPSGRVEIASGILARHSYGALPVYRGPLGGPLHGPEFHRKYLLILSTGARIVSAFRLPAPEYPVTGKTAGQAAGVAGCSGRE